MVHILRIVRKKVRADPLGFLVLCVKQKTEGVYIYRTNERTPYRNNMYHT